MSAIFLLAGCVALGDVAEPVDQIDHSVAVSANQAILLNVMRASEKEPLYFVSLSQVSGSGNLTVNAGLPTIKLGVSQNEFDVSSSAANSLTANYQVGVLNSDDFYQRLLKPIDLVEANLLLHQGFSRPLVFSLLIDQVRKYQGNTATALHNTPSDPSFGEFQNYLEAAIAAGITIESYQQPGTATGGAGAATATGAKFCFDATLTDPNRPDLQKFASASPTRCTEEGAGPTTGRRSPEFNIGGQLQSFDVTLRSPYQIFQYLGQMLHDGTAGLALADPANTQPLFAVTQSGSACFTQVSFEGTNYCVPSQNSENTKEVFSLLNQILALNTSQSNLPATTTVQLVQ